MRIIFGLTALLLSCTANPTFAQSSEPEMASLMYSNGKIYVVVAVLLTLLAGIFVYLFLLERRIKKIEKNEP
jgi:hypothetical protein